MRDGFKVFWLIMLVGAWPKFIFGFSQIADISTQNWNIELSAPQQVALPGSLTVFDGVITNNTGLPLVLDTANLNFTTSAPDSSYTKDYADAFLATLGIIPTTGYSGALFQIQWSSGVAGGTLGFGSFALTAEQPAIPQSLSVPFQLQVDAVPEPGTFGLAMVAIGGLVIVGGPLCLLRTLINFRPRSIPGKSV